MNREQAELLPQETINARHGEFFTTALKELYRRIESLEQELERIHEALPSNNGIGGQK